MRKSMTEALMKGEALNVLTEGTKINDGVYELQKFTPNKLYCVPLYGWWIRSIGQRISDGKIFAAVDHRYSNSPNYSCLYSED